MAHPGKEETGMFLLISFLFVVLGVGLTPFLRLPKEAKTMYSIPASQVWIRQYGTEQPVPIMRCIPEHSVLFAKGDFIHIGVPEVLATVEIFVFADAIALLVLFSKYRQRVRRSTNEGELT